MTTYSKRQEKFKAYNFKCECPLCQIDSKDPGVARREKFFEKNYEKIRLGISQLRIDEKQVEALVDKVKETYRDRTEYQTDLFLPLSLLANVYMLRSKFKKVGETFLKIHEIFKDIEMSLATTSAIQAYNAFKTCEMTKEAQECLKSAVLSNCLGDEDFFFYYFAKILKQ